MEEEEEKFEEVKQGNERFDEDDNVNKLESYDSKLNDLVFTDEDGEIPRPRKNIEEYNRISETAENIRKQNSILPSTYASKQTAESRNNPMSQPQSPQFSAQDPVKQNLIQKPSLPKSGTETIELNSIKLNDSPGAIRITIPDKDKTSANNFALQLQQVSGSVLDDPSNQSKIQLSFDEGKSKDMLALNGEENLRAPFKSSQYLASTDFLSVVKSNTVCTPQNALANAKFNTFGTLAVKSCKCEDILVVDDNDFNLLC